MSTLVDSGNRIAIDRLPLFSGKGPVLVPGVLEARSLSADHIVLPELGLLGCCPESLRFAPTVTMASPGRIIAIAARSQRGVTLRALRYMSTTRQKTWQQEHLEAPQGGAAIPNNLTVRQRRIIYRSKQRGWLELDILMGSWAVKNVPMMADETEICKVEDLLEQDTPKVLKWVLGQEHPPPRFQNNVMKSLRDFAGGDGHVNDR